MTTLNWTGNLGTTTFRDVGSPTDPNAVVSYKVTGTYNPSSVFDGGGNDVLAGTANADVIFLDNTGYSTPRFSGITEIDSGDGDDLVDLTSARFKYGPITLRGEDGNDWLLGNDGNDSIHGDNGNDRLKGYAGDDTLYGGSGNDQLFGGKGDDTIDGGNGIDTAYFSGGIKDYAITRTATGYTIKDKVGAEGTDTLLDVERAVFSGKRVAFDMGADQSGGKTVLLLATCLGSGSLANQSPIIDTLLTFFDAGNTIANAASALISSGIAAQLAGGSDDRHIVGWIGHNVLGSGFSSELEKACLGYVSQHGQADFLAAVSTLGLNISLVGLQQTGIEYA